MEIEWIIKDQKEIGGYRITLEDGQVEGNSIFLRFVIATTTTRRYFSADGNFLAIRSEDLNIYSFRPALAEKYVGKYPFTIYNN